MTSETGTSAGPGSRDATASGAEGLRSRAEAEKTARLLGVKDPEHLAFLRELPPDDLARFRAQAVAALFDGAPDMLERIASATKLVPASVAAVISQKALGPRLAAAVAGRLDAPRAAAIVEKLPVPFTAASCAHLDPRRIRDLVERLDEDLVVKIAVRLAEDGDFLTMGRFTGHLRDGALRRIIGLISDEAVLRTGYFIDQPERIGPILGLMDGERLDSVVRTAADGGLWAEALTVLGMADEERRAAVLARPPLREPALLDRAVREVVDAGLWAAFLPMAYGLPEESRKAVADAAARLPDADLEAMAYEVTAHDLWDAVLPLVELMEDGAKERILALPAFREGAAG